jgi:hypothetical protein
MTLATYVFPRLSAVSFLDLRAKAVLRSIWKWKDFAAHRTRQLWELVDLIAGASFVLTGSLHAAILAQVYGVPWAVFDDGYIDFPPKWEDWCAYLGIRPSYVKSLAEGRQWWNDVGVLGQIRGLRRLLASFPYLDASPNARYFLTKLPE